MVNPLTMLGQIGESFETIGENVAKETASVPKDLAGAALESVGLSSGGKGKQGKPAQATHPMTEKEQQQQADLEATKRAVARAALEEISGKRSSAQKEPTVWEKLQREEEEKKAMEKKQKEQAAKQALPQVSSKRKRGDLYGLKAKKASAEMSRNVKSD